MTTAKTKSPKNVQRTAQAKKTPVAKGTRRVHSEEFKQRVLAECTQEGVTIKAVAMRHKLSRSLVQKWRATASVQKVPPVAKVQVGTITPEAQESQQSVSDASLASPMLSNAIMTPATKGTVVELKTLRGAVVELQALRSAIVDRDALRATVKRLEIEKELLKELLMETLGA